MAVHLPQGPIDPQGSDYQNLLANLQGNIIKPHARNHAVHIMLKFKAEVASVRRWMSTFAELYITSAQRQLQDASDFRMRGLRGQLFGNLFLSATGYKALGYTQDDLVKAFPNDQEGLRPVVFRNGMAAHASLLHDPDPATQWEETYRSQHIDAMLLLAHENLQVLETHESTVRRGVLTIADIVTTEWGHRLWNTSNNPVEPFGYVDGISQPLFLQEDGLDAALRHNPHEDPSASLDLVLVSDPFAPQPPGGVDCFGSYLVFRKLEQKLRAFRQRIRDMATHLGCSEAEAEALVMGRFKNGVPLIASKTSNTSLADLNDFNYDQDKSGNKCPFQAHIRRLNPRGETQGREEERRRRIVRRSIPYGLSAETKPDTLTYEQLPASGVGLLFMCFQRSLSNQFGSLQMIWGNAVTQNTGSQKFIGPDPIIGQPSDSSRSARRPSWPLHWGKSAWGTFGFQGYVTLKGGEFFFAPSLPFFKSLA